MVSKPSLHSPIGPSSFGRAESCTASAILYNEGAIHDRDLTWSNRGTFMHRIFEQCLSDPGLLPVEFIDEEQDGYTITEEDIEELIFAVDFARGQIEEGDEVRLETRMHLEGTSCFGTADVVILKPKGEIVIIDLKTGFTPVSKQAVQVGLYCTMAAQLHSHDGPVLSYVLQTPHRKASKHIWAPGDQRNLVARVKRVEAEVQGRQFRWKAGDHCQYCSTLPVCPHLRQLAADAVAATIVTHPDETMTGDDLSLALDQAKGLKHYIKTIEEAALRYAQRGGSLKDYKLVKKTGNRKWMDERAAVEALRKMNIEPYGRSVISPAQAEKLLPKLYHPKVKEMVTKPTTGQTIASRVNDERPEIKTAVPDSLDRQLVAVTTDRIKTGKLKA